MKTLADIHSQDARLWADATLTEEQYRSVLLAAAPVFREGSHRPAFPTTVINDPGVIKSRHINVIDIGDAEHGMKGTGGTWDRADQTPTDILAYAIWKNVEVPWREQETSERSGFNVLRESGIAAGEKVGERENTMLIAGLGPNKGLTNAADIQTFAGGADWATAGQPFKDINKAVNNLMIAKKVPRGAPKAMVCNEAQYAELFHEDLTKKDMAQIERLLPGGVFTSTDCPAGKAYVYARTPTVIEYRVYEELSVIPLPKIDQDHRMRTRVIGALHVKKPDGVVEINTI